MKTVWKFQLSDEWFTSISAPAGAKFLAVQVQNGVPCVWAEVDPEQPPSQYELAVTGTGHATPEGEYLGTFQLESLVFHVWNITP